MKHKGMKQIVSMLLAVVMLLSLMPATTLTAFAEELETINSVSLSGLSMPVVGEHISSVSGSALSESQYGKYEYAVLDNQYADWRDEEGRLIEYGLQVFEAGRTYSISFNIKPKDGYAFTDSSIPVYMSNLYDPQYTSNITLSQETSVATVTFTFELAGERTYADISEFRFYNVTAPSDGDQAHYYNGVWAYNNSEMTDRYWAAVRVIALTPALYLRADIVIPITMNSQPLTVINLLTMFQSETILLRLIGDTLSMPTIQRFSSPFLIILRVPQLSILLLWKICSCLHRADQQETLTLTCINTLLVVPTTLSLIRQTVGMKLLQNTPQIRNTK